MARDFEWQDSTFEPTTDFERDTQRQLREQYRHALELRLQPVCSASRPSNPIVRRSSKRRSTEAAEVSAQSLH